MEALAASTKTAGYDTNHDANVAAASTGAANLLRDLVDLAGIEPATSSMPFPLTKCSPSDSNVA
jgi:hypothetical protein